MTERRYVGAWAIYPWSSELFTRVMATREYIVVAPPRERSSEFSAPLADALEELDSVSEETVTLHGHIIRYGAVEAIVFFQRSDRSGFDRLMARFNTAVGFLMWIQRLSVSVHLGTKVKWRR